MTRTHHGQHDPGCFGCKILSVGFAPSAMPTRHPEAARIVAKDARWDRDIAAYCRMRHTGVTPSRIDGSAEIESRATTRHEVRSGRIIPDHKLARRIDAVQKDLGR